jgi:hypothetical protein
MMILLRVNLEQTNQHFGSGALHSEASAKSRSVNLLKCWNRRLRRKLRWLPVWAAPTGKRLE